MLCISMRAGEYFTLGQDVVVQFDRLSGDRIHLIINAPREVPIVRGEVLEREGGKRPVCVRNISPQYIRQLPWNHKKKEALAELRQALAEMEDSPQTEILREKLNIIFPAPPEGGETVRPAGTAV